MVRDNLSEDQYFYLASGQTIRNLVELKDILHSIDDKTFSEHVNGQKNDFAAWIRGCMYDGALADRIGSATTPQEMIKALEALDDDSGFTSPGDFFSGTIGSFNTAIAPSLKTKTDADKSSPAAAKTGKTEAAEEKQRRTKKRSASAKRDSKKAVSEKLSSPSSSSSVKKPAKKRSLSSPAKIAPSKNASSKEASVLEQADDYSFDLDGQKDILAQIRERIRSMDTELKEHSSSSYSSLASFDEKYPELAHSTLDDGELKSSRSQKRFHHHIADATKKAAHHVRHRAKRVHHHVSQRLDDVKKQAQLRKYSRQNKKAKGAQHEVEASSDEKSSKGYDYGSVEVIERDTGKVNYDMESLYGQPVQDSKKRVPFFRSVLSRFRKAEKVVEKELPNLHEFEHAKKAQEIFTPYRHIEHPKNYHLHGVPDFVRGLIIGILLGMLFLVIF